MVGARRTALGLPVTGATLALVAALTLSGAQAARADVVCTSDSCDGGLWQMARGPLNTVSYWGMDAGHNCTNYVAWKLITNGVARPRTSPGDASTWAINAYRDGFVVDATPTVGAVAQWDAFAGGYGAAGHVAYVEKVNDDGTVLLSEDYWHEGDQTGPLTFRTVAASSVQHFIHYTDFSRYLRLGGLQSTGWSETSTGVRAAPGAISAVNMGGTAPVIVYNHDGVMYQAASDASGWHVASTGMSSTATTIVAVKMGGSVPQIMSVDGSVLYLTVQTSSGWQKMSTGVRITGEITALDMGGLWPTVFASQDGKLYRVWGDPRGWHAELIPVSVRGAISAVTDGTIPEVFSVEDGVIQRIWLDAAGWHKESTGITSSGPVAAVSTSSGTQIFTSDSDLIYRVTYGVAGWTRESTGLAAGSVFWPVDFGGASPVLIQGGGRSAMLAPTSDLFAVPTADPNTTIATPTVPTPTPTPTPWAVPTPADAPTSLPAPSPTVTDVPVLPPAPATSPVPVPTPTSTP